MRINKLAEIIFNEAYEVYDKNDVCMEILDYGLENKKLLYIDYKGEENQEIVNYILDYEFENEFSKNFLEEYNKFLTFT